MKALSDWLRWCRAAVGEVNGTTFVRLLEMLVESVLLYGAEVWGCGGQLRPVGKIQLLAARIVLGAGRLHPSVFLQFEMGILPLKWEVVRRTLAFGCKL